MPNDQFYLEHGQQRLAYLLQRVRGQNRWMQEQMQRVLDTLDISLFYIISPSDRLPSGR